MRFGRVHDAIKRRILPEMQAFEVNNGYVPPYWQLLAIIRRVRAEEA
jgi:hypothetical protein